MGFKIKLRKETNLYEDNAIANGIAEGASRAVENQTQTDIFNKLTNNGTIRGIYMQNGQMYVNMDYLQTGTLKLGGANNGNGLMVVYNASGAEIGRWDKDGLTATGNLTMKNGDYTGYIGTIIYPDYSIANNTLSFKTGTGFGIVNGNTYYDVKPSGTGVTIATMSQLGIVEENYVGESNGDGFIEYISMAPSYYQRDLFPTGIYKSSRYYFEEKYSPTTGSYYLSSRLFASGSSYRVSLNLNGELSLLYISAGSVVMDMQTSHQRINGRDIQFVSSSAKRYKHSITANISEDLDAHKLYELPMKQFVFNDDHQLQYDDMKGKTIPGFIAEDVAEIYPSAVIHDGDGNIESWDERRIVPAMLKLIQEQHEEIEELKQALHVD